MAVDGISGLPLLAVLNTLRPYLNDVVLAGGWVPFVYHRYVLPHVPDPPRTYDVDLVVPPQLAVRAGQTVDEILTEAGCSQELLGDSNPPVTRYGLPLGKLEVEIEFLTTQTGKAATRAVQAGLSAQALPYLRLLSENAERVHIHDKVTGGTFDADVRVASPAAFVFQKGLTFARRATGHQRTKAAKDLYYIYDVLDFFEPLHDQLYVDLAAFKQEYPANWHRTFTSNLKERFGPPTSEGAAMVASQRPANVRPEMTHAQFERFVRGLFAQFLERIE